MYADIQPSLGAAGYQIGMDFNQFFQAISDNFIFQRTDIDLSLIKKDSWVVEFFPVNIILTESLHLGMIQSY